MLAVDSHCHVFDPRRFPFARDAGYTPPPQEQGTAEELVTVLDANGIARAVIVNPTSGYGYDNRCMMAAVRSSKGRFKGIARVRPDIGEFELASLAASGAIGIRLDLIGDGVGLLQHASIDRLFAELREMKWQVHVQCEKDQLAEALPTLRRAGVPLVVDHCGRPDPRLSTAQPGFQALLELGREGHAVKLSGAFRFSRQPPPYDDLDPFIAAIVATFMPRQCVFGSDWPFVRMRDRPRYADVLALLTRWLPDEDARRQVLWDTPARLFGFR
jgi:predicted TIM-barrel fold metal-dependent hydrolase